MATHQYLRGLCSEKTLYTSPNPGLSLPAAHSSEQQNRTYSSNLLLTAHYNELCFYCLFLREYHNLPLQVKRHGEAVQGSASGPELHRLGLLSQVRQDRTKGRSPS